MEVTERKRRGPQENVRKIGSGKLRRQEKLIATLRWPNTVFKSLCLILHNF